MFVNHIHTDNRLDSMRNHTRPTLPTHMSQLPPLPPAYIRPTSTRDLPTYRPAQATPSTGPHAAWAAPAPPYKPRDPPSAGPTDTPIVTSSPPAPRRSIFRRPVPPLHTADDLAPPPDPIPGAQAQVLPQVTPYEHRRGENPFGTRGVDERHPGAAESEAGDVPAGNRVVNKSQDSPPVYAEAVGR